MTKLRIDQVSRTFPARGSHAPTRALEPTNLDVGDNDFVANLAVDLNGQFDLLVDRQALVIVGPGFVGEGFLMAQALPDFFGDVGGEGSEQQDKAFDGLLTLLRQGAVMVGEDHPL